MPSSSHSRDDAARHSASDPIVSVWSALPDVGHNLNDDRTLNDAHASFSLLEMDEALLETFLNYWR